MKSGFSPEAILLVRAATFLQRLFIGWRLLCSAHAAARACQETLRCGIPSAQRDLLQWHTMDLVHEQDFTLARSEPADKLVVACDPARRTHRHHGRRRVRADGAGSGAARNALRPLRIRFGAAARFRIPARPTSLRQLAPG